MLKGKKQSKVEKLLKIKKNFSQGIHQLSEIWYKIVKVNAKKIYKDLCFNLYLLKNNFKKRVEFVLHPITFLVKTMLLNT